MAEASIKQPLYDISGEHVAEVVIPAHATGASEIYPIFYANGAETKVKSVLIIPSADVTGANTNTTHINLFDRDADGNGTTEIGNYDLTLGNDLDAYDAYELYAPATKLSLSAGEVLSIQLEEVGTGLALPTLLVIVRYTG